MEQKVLITSSQSEINNLINQGWFVKMCIAQHVGGGTSYKVTGDFFVLFEREVQQS